MDADIISDMNPDLVLCICGHTRINHGLKKTDSICRLFHCECSSYRSILVLGPEQRDHELKMLIKDIIHMSDEFLDHNHIETCLDYLTEALRLAKFLQSLPNGEKTS